MLTNGHIYRTIREAALLTQHDFNLNALHHVEANQRTYDDGALNEFVRDLTEAGNEVRILFLEYNLSKTEFYNFLEKEAGPVATFINGAKGVQPVILAPHKKKWKTILIDSDDTSESLDASDDLSLIENEHGQIRFFAIFNYDSPLGTVEEGVSLSPIARLAKLLGTERKEILYILFYAIVIGLVSLILPLGIQTTVELVSGGVVFSSVYVMIGLVIVGVLLTGGLQIIQISLVEFLQRRIFSKAAFEFAYRLPRLKMEAIQKNYAPELVNRFFDVMTIQKGLPKLLIDLTSSAIQILFGLLLISLYHPFFVFFGLLLIAMLALIFYLTGPGGLSSSIRESKYKYKVAQWLEELARALPSFKMAGNTSLPLRKTDVNVNNYLKNRKVHFNTLVTQFSFIVLFKALITGGLLIMGTVLVVDRKITLGQFVASEIVIILILNAVEKIIMYMDVVYDLLTAVDKVGLVTDLPIERTGGFDFNAEGTRGYGVVMKDLSYNFPGSHSPALDKINLRITPGEVVCIAGNGGAGKTTLSNILTGFYSDFNGVATINDYSLRDLDLTHLRDNIAKNISQEDLFDGTILENLTLGRPASSIHEAIRAIERVGLADMVNRMPEGLETPVVSGGKGLSQTAAHKMVLARCLIKKPKLIILNDFFAIFSKAETLALLSSLIQDDRKWTLIMISNDPLILGVSDRVVVLDKGQLKADGKFDVLLQEGVLNDFIDQK